MLCSELFWLFVFTDILYEHLICTTTSVKYQKHICQKIKPSEYCSWVTFKLPYSASVLLIDSDLLYICGIRWPPENKIFRWPGATLCIQITSYMIWKSAGIQKTNFNKKQRGDYLGVIWADFVFQKCFYIGRILWLKLRLSSWQIIPNV